MGKHAGGYGDYKPGRDGTNAGPGFQSLTPEQKAAEFDSSASDPAGYAERNFTPNDGKHRK